MLQSLQTKFLDSAPEGIKREQPYHHCEVLSFRSFKQLQDQIDVIRILRSSFKRSLMIKLSVRNRGIMGIPGALLPSDIPWRYSFWGDVASDLPSLLTEDGYGDPYLSTVPQFPKTNDQVLSQHPYYTRKAILVRDTFQSFDRKDGKNSGPLSSEHVTDPTN